jgi:hypothetical protein
MISSHQIRHTPRLLGQAFIGVAREWARKLSPMSVQDWTESLLMSAQLPDGKYLALEKGMCVEISQQDEFPSAKQRKQGRYLYFRVQGDEVVVLEHGGFK